jgi:hypothetical protein
VSASSDSGCHCLDCMQGPVLPHAEALQDVQQAAAPLKSPTVEQAKALGLSRRGCCRQWQRCMQAAVLAHAGVITGVQQPVLALVPPKRWQLEQAAEVCSAGSGRSSGSGTGFDWQGCMQGAYCPMLKCLLMCSNQQAPLKPHSCSRQEQFGRIGVAVTLNHGSVCRAPYAPKRGDIWCAAASAGTGVPATGAGSQRKCQPAVAVASLPGLHASHRTAPC